MIYHKNSYDFILFNVPQKSGEKKGRNQNGKVTQFTGRIFKSGEKREDTCNYLHHKRLSVQGTCKRI